MGAIHCLELTEGRILERTAAGSYNDGKQRSPFLVGGFQQWRQLFRVDEVGSQKVGAHQEDAHPSHCHLAADAVAPPLALADFLVAPDFYLLVTSQGLEVRV